MGWIEANAGEFAGRLVLAGHGRGLGGRDAVWRMLDLGLLCEAAYALLVDGRTEEERADLDNTLDDGPRPVSTMDEKRAFLAGI